MLRSALLRFLKSRRLVGFCKWSDGKGLLFGRVLDVDVRTVRFELVNPDGTIDEEFSVALSKITRLDESPDYVRRLELFARLSVKKSDGQRTTNRALIKKRVMLAARTGECVDVMLKDEPRRDCKIVRVEDGWVELVEYGDYPFTVVEKRVVRMTQIKELRWRSSVHLLITKAWKSKRRR